MGIKWASVEIFSDVKYASSGVTNKWSFDAVTIVVCWASLAYWAESPLRENLCGYHALQLLKRHIRRLPVAESGDAHLCQWKATGH